MSDGLIRIKPGKCRKPVISMVMAVAGCRSCSEQQPIRTIFEPTPADRRKEGSAFDLPIAHGVLVAFKQIKPISLGDFALLAELSLNGSVRPIHGMLSTAASLHEEGLYGMIVPPQNAREAASKVDVGTTFRLHIPLTRSPETPAS